MNIWLDMDLESCRHKRC